MIAPSILELLTDVAWSVVLAVTPLILLFLVFQALFIRLPAAEVSRVLGGALLAAAGLFLFLLGVGLAFLPFGQLIGQTVARLPQAWLPPMIGVLLGFVTAWSEPSVRILASEVEDASGGSIRNGLVLVAVAIGVAVSVGIGVMRIQYDIPLAYLLVPGYGAVLAIMVFTDKTFVAIAADSGGVATGPLANSFLLALALGAASAFEGYDPLLDGFGLIALISLAPVLSVMTVGLLIRLKTRSAT